MRVDDLLRGLLFRTFRMGTVQFEFLEGLLAVCITGAAYLLRTPFETGLPHWPYVLAEWYLAAAAAALVQRLTASRKKALVTYGLLLILPVGVAEGTILRGNACVGALLFLCALLFLMQSEKSRGAWLFTIVTAVLLLWSVRYAGLLTGCVVLWQNRRLRAEQLLLLLAAGGARLFHACRAWLGAGYTLVTFHWPNVYEIVGREAVQGQRIDPLALVGLFLAGGLSVLFLYLFSMGKPEQKGLHLLRLFLFCVLFTGYVLPYMDQSYGYLPCVLAILYMMTAPGEFLAPLLLQIVAFAGYQECFNGESMMPMAVFAVLQLLVILWLGAELLRDAGMGNYIWKRKKIVYLDGLKGLGCVIVFLTHFVYAFYYGMYHFQPESCHLPGNLDIAVGKSPLNLFFNGNTAVRLFLVISGYLLCRNFFLTGDKSRLVRSARKRYLRLMPAVLAVNAVIFVCMKLGLYYNTPAAAVAGSEEWFAGFNAFAPSLSGMLKESLYGCFLFGSNDYNGVLWTIQILFLGAYLDYALAAFVSRFRFRWLLYGVLAAALLRTDFLSICLGYVLCDLMHTDWSWRKRLCGCRPLNWLLLAAGLYFMSYPSAGFGYEGTIWGLLPLVLVNYYHIFGALCFVTAVLNLEPLQQFFSMRGFLYLGRISYSLYLIHFLVTATFGAWFLLAFYEILGYNLTSFLNLILISGITVLLSELSCRYVEPLSKKGEVLIGRIFDRR